MASPLPERGAGGARSTLERMPKWLICVPLVLQWLWLALRHGSLTLPSAANPAITSGGLVGETKLEYFRSMGALAMSATARHCALPAQARGSLATVRAALAQEGIGYPLIAKPDLGMCGFGVRRIDSEPELARYIADFPAEQAIVLQEYLAEEGEAGIFYARDPGAAQGRIIGLALRYFPQVTGDGISSIDALIAADPRAGRVRHAGHSLALDGARVPAAGERVRLATIGSTRVGGLYRDGSACITPALATRIDGIARDMAQFHFGRFDVRFDGLDALRAGRVRIMEVNGAGSEAIEAWDPAFGLVRALRIIFAKQRTLFRIAAANRRRGHQPIGLWQLARLHFMQQKLLDAYPPSN
ncbi:hypothetical protein ACFPOE_04640 [Caenimonas terrae]|uniref:ATP-grasp domain-containing protein n=1 Tax=Caenimonas terrae TaxID=696074 RepID=A0ABW0NB74_9BURK